MDILILNNDSFEQNNCLPFLVLSSHFAIPREIENSEPHQTILYNARQHLRKSTFLSLVVVQNNSFYQSVSPAKMRILLDECHFVESREESFRTNLAHLNFFTFYTAIGVKGRLLSTLSLKCASNEHRGSVMDP